MSKRKTTGTSNYEGKMGQRVKKLLNLLAQRGNGGASGLQHLERKRPKSSLSIRPKLEKESRTLCRSTVEGGEFHALGGRGKPRDILPRA